ncbi:MAG: heavy metal-associated domain-containing protein [Candidatus Limiplasma sp.]|jgi:copper chaperone CopZ|nr:heavy-metal-associated domain-containing protein [Clostridiales bacterium]MDY3243740.1 heavy metal-associated domain-containing protein [Candidatus Limiplasma sp.]MDY4063157.1 heavy metal-associated domain-containing protein [Candidatus Limiplasma sp.]
MKKTYALDELDCANCGLKMEDAIRKIEGVKSVNISFMMQKITLEADDADFERVLKEAVKVCKKVEPDCRIVVK